MVWLSRMHLESWAPARCPNVCRVRGIGLLFYGPYCRRVVGMMGRWLLQEDFFAAALLRGSELLRQVHGKRFACLCAMSIRVALRYSMSGDAFTALVGKPGSVPTVTELRKAVMQIAWQQGSPSTVVAQLSQAGPLAQRKNSESCVLRSVGRVSILVDA